MGKTHTSSSSTYFRMCLLYISSSTKYANPVNSPGSFRMLERNRFFSRKLASIARWSRYNHLKYCLRRRQWNEWRKIRYRSEGATDRNPSGRLTRGLGQVGHLTASSPWAVPPIPFGSWPLPPRFIMRSARHSRMMSMNAWVRACDNLSIVLRTI